VKLHLGGHLAFYDPEKRSHLELEIKGKVSLVALLQQLKVPLAEIALVVVNSELVELENSLITNTDRVDLYPPIGGGTKIYLILGEKHGPDHPTGSLA
jgi:sulfur carrier protein ThiS